MRKLLAATLITAAATLASLNTAQASTLAASAQAQSTLDMEAIHRAYFQMPSSAPAQALSWFEEQVNRFNHGSEFVSIAAQQAHLSGQPVTVVSGYIDRDGVPGLNAGSDQVLFRFVQTAPLSARGLSYEFVDGSGLVYYRGSPRAARLGVLPGVLPGDRRQLAVHQLLHPVLAPRVPAELAPGLSRHPDLRELVRHQDLVAGHARQAHRGLLIDHIDRIGVHIVVLGIPGDRVHHAGIGRGHRGHRAPIPSSVLYRPGTAPRRNRRRAVVSDVANY